MSRYRDRFIAVSAVWLAVSSSSSPASAQQPERDESGTSADDLAAIEASLATDAEVAEATSTPPAPAAANQLSLDAAFILDVAGAWFSEEEPLQTGAHDPQVTGFNFQQLELSVGASVDPFLRFDASIVFSLFGVEVEEAFASTLALPGSLKLRAGQFLTRFGRLNATHPHSWSFVDQPIVNSEFFGGEGSRGVGAELSWLTPLPWYVDLIGSSTMANGETAPSFYGDEELSVRGPQDLLYTTRIEQFFPFSDTFSLLWGVSAQFGPNATGPNNRTEIYGTDLYLRYRPPAGRSALSLQLEGMIRNRQVPDSVQQNAGGRAELVWSINPSWETGARLEWLDPDEGDRTRGTLQATYYPSHFSRLRLQSSVDVPSWVDRPIYAAMLSLEILVGAHGSHSY